MLDFRGRSSTTILLLCGLSSQPVQAVICPPGQNELIQAQVKAVVSQDPVTKLYTYRYEVTNAPESRLNITALYVDIVGEVSEIASPQGWAGGANHEQNFENHPLGFVDWSTTAVEPPPPGQDYKGFPPPMYPIKPGMVMRDFSFKSPKAPGPAKFFVENDLHFPSAPSEEEAEALLDECPRGVVGNIFETSYQGTTQGPVDFLPVTINIKQKSLNPKSQGVIPVAILSTADFDAGTVNPLSVRFGPGAAPEIHNRGHGEDANGDGKNDLVLHFDTQASGIRCGDTSATLTGITISGQGIQGADTFVTVGCK